MATFQRSTRIRAPLEDVWRFHSTVDGLEALTPAFLHLEVHEVVGPDGVVDPEELEAGTRLHLSIRPFGIGPRRHWTSIIVERHCDEGAARFVDVMTDGPFQTWRHEHSFVADGAATVLTDRVEYALPGGVAGRLASPFGLLGLEPMFRERHRRTKTDLESGADRQ